eukprot:TRINITY_DN72263_c0_g1_i1.p1 TRINITY_DN72263_c0_g1~~TRINITY_DN72263_c0_g1_i1.p1  ORF type:complete len:584 (-),score=115.12 TRINITY_DN72263_c0_g1_i1:139-1890(-)
MVEMLPAAGVESNADLEDEEVPFPENPLLPSSHADALPASLSRQIARKVALGSLVVLAAGFAAVLLLSAGGRGVADAALTQRQDGERASIELTGYQDGGDDGDGDGAEELGAGVAAPPPELGPPISSGREMLEIFKQSPMTGVNLGGWLCLEDWFFSGADGAHVMSLHGQGQGACLPPLVKYVEQKWPSEGILTNNLRKSHGDEYVVKAFAAHRSEFIPVDDFSIIASLGIKMLRLPLSWAAFADALAPIDHELYGTHNPDKDMVIVPDPFYKDTAAFVTTPREQLEDVLRKAAQNGLKVLIVLHNFPGGAQQGTYNGVWPLEPMFWKQEQSFGPNRNRLSELGTWIAKALVDWVVGLDEAAQAGVGGITMMNEPAHMNRFKHFADENVVLDWLASAAQNFRTSKLPSKGIKLYMNIMDSAFKNFDETVVPWFWNTFTEEERKTWVVADNHWYAAWATRECDGRSIEGGAYECTDSRADISAVMHGCIKGQAKLMLERFGSEGALLAFSELSAGTFEDARHACKDRRETGMFVEEILARLAASGIQGFFWTWRMPYGPTFEAGWSLKWLLGLEKTDGESNVCR